MLFVRTQYTREKQKVKRRKQDRGQMRCINLNGGICEVAVLDDFAMSRKGVSNTEVSFILNKTVLPWCFTILRIIILH